MILSKFLMERTKGLDKTYVFNLLKCVAKLAQKEVIQRPKIKWEKEHCALRGCQVQITQRISHRPWSSSASILTFKRAQALEFKPWGFTKKDPTEIAFIKVAPQSIDWSTNFREGKRKEWMHCFCTEKIEKNITSAHFGH